MSSNIPGRPVRESVGKPLVRNRSRPIKISAGKPGIRRRRGFGAANLLALDYKKGNSPTVHSEAAATMSTAAHDVWLAEEYAKQDALRILKTQQKRLAAPPSPIAPVQPETNKKLGLKKLSPVSSTSISVSGTGTVMEAIKEGTADSFGNPFWVVTEVWACDDERYESTFRCTGDAIVRYSQKLLEGQWGNAAEDLYFHRDLWNWCDETLRKRLRSLGAKTIYANTRSLKYF